MPLFLQHITKKHKKIINYISIIFFIFFLFFNYNIQINTDETNFSEKIIIYFLNLFFIIIWSIIIFINNFFQNYIKNNNKIKIEDLNIMNGEERLGVFLSHEIHYQQEHQFITNYYFILEDLSFNIICNIKWIKYGIKSIIQLKNILISKDYIEEYLIFENNINSNDTLQQLFLLKNIKNEKHIIELLINENLISIDDNFNIDILIEKLNVENNIQSSYVYSENDLILLKLKLNVVEFIILSSKKYGLNFSTILSNEEYKNL